MKPADQQVVETLGGMTLGIIAIIGIGIFVIIANLIWGFTIVGVWTLLHRLGIPLWAALLGAILLCAAYGLFYRACEKRRGK